MKMESYLSTGKREVQGGLERYTFRMAASGFLAAAERADGNEDVLNQSIVGWYTLSPRPDPRDILSSTVRPLEDHRVEVELVIRRGHYALLSLLHSHPEGLYISKEGRVTCDCHPDDPPHWIMRNTLPNYEKELAETDGE